MDILCGKLTICLEEVILIALAFGGVMDERSRFLERIADTHQRIDITLLSSLTENWMDCNYTMSQLKVLLCLYIDGPYRMRDLADAIGVSTPTATGIVNRLVRRGAIIRKHDTEDRRVVTCQLSIQGDQEIAALWMAKYDIYQQLFGTLSLEELDVVARAVEVILAAAKKRNSGLPLPLPSMGVSDRP